MNARTIDRDAYLSEVEELLNTVVEESNRLVLGGELMHDPATIGLVIRSVAEAAKVRLASALGRDAAAGHVPE